MCFDAEMKRLRNSGLGSKTKKAQPLSIEEEILWQRGLLGKSNPQALLDTMGVMNGLYFALRSGKEHRQLRFSPCQITLHKNEGDRPCLEYIEDTSKNRTGGLKTGKFSLKLCSTTTIQAIQIGVLFSFSSYTIVYVPLTG